MLNKALLARTRTELDEFAVEAVTITADTCSDAIAVFHEQMRGCSFEIITVRPFVEPVL
jgi:hypothetical protein